MSYENIFPVVSVNLDDNGDYVYHEDHLEVVKYFQERLSAAELSETTMRLKSADFESKLMVAVSELEHVNNDFAYCQELNAGLLIEREQIRAQLKAMQSVEISGGGDEHVAELRITHGGYGAVLSTHVAYALPEGIHKVYAQPSPNKADVPSAVFNKLMRIELGGCTCITKTPDIEFHKEYCKYRLAREIVELLKPLPPLKDE